MVNDKDARRIRNVIEIRYGSTITKGVEGKEEQSIL